MSVEEFKGSTHPLYGTFDNPLPHPVEDKFVRQEIVRDAYKAVLQELLTSLNSVRPGCGNRL